MKRFDLKQLLLCIATLVSSQFELAGVYPLIPAVFMTGFLSGVNRSLLFLCTMGGLIILAPVTVLVKYGLIVLLSAVLIRGVEWYSGYCRTVPAAVLTAGITVAVGIGWSSMKLPGTSAIFIRICEGILVCGFIYVVTKLLALIPEWEPRSAGELPVYVPGGQRLNEYAESFEKLSKTFRQMNRYKEDFTAEELGRMQTEVTGRICASCNQCTICWEENTTPMYQVLYRFLQALQRGADVNESAQELEQYCPYRDEMIEQIMLVFEKAHLNLAWYNRLQENRDVIAQQLDAMAYIMEDCANEEQDVTMREGKLAATMRYAWKERGITVEQLHILENSHGKWQIYFQGKTRGTKCISVKEMAKIISSVSGRIFKPVKDSKALLGAKSMSLLFCESCRLTAYYGVAKAIRDDEQVSGDNFSFQMLDNGSCIMSVSDGMGSGYAACKESEMVIDLIEKFMEAGFLPDTALRMMNSAMVTHGENNLFSTVDLMRLDLDSGMAEFYKIGSAVTFIRHGDEVRVVEQNSLPVGVFAGQKVPKITQKLENSDFVVMVTDGVLEHLHVDNANQAMKEIIRTITTNNPAQFAREILDQVLLFTGGRVRDDMTILTAGIWER